MKNKKKRYVGAILLVILVITTAGFLPRRMNKKNIDLESNIEIGIVDTDIEPVEELEEDTKEKKKMNYTASLEFALKEEKKKQREEDKVLEEEQRSIEQEQASADRRDSDDVSKDVEVRNNKKTNDEVKRDKKVTDIKDNKSDISKVIKDGKEVIEIDESPSTIIDETIREYKGEAKQDGIDWGNDPKPSGKMPNGDIPAGGKQGVGDWN